MRKLQKFISITLSLLLMISVFAGIRPGTAQAAAGVPTFFIPDDGTLKSTANMSVNTSPTPLDRTTAYLTNDQKLNISGSFQQVTDTSMNVTVDQIAYIGSTWTPQTGKTFNTKVLTDGPNRFKINNLPLFAGFNRITISGQQNNVDKSDVFYVLFEASPVIKSMQMLDSTTNTNVDLNEGSQMVTKQQQVVITGVVVNADEVFVNGVKGSVTPSTGRYYTPAVPLVSGVNDLNFTFKNNNGEELKVLRQLYFYDSKQPFSQVVVTHGDFVPASYPTQSQDIAKGPKTFTGDDPTAKLSFQMMVPYNAAYFPIDSSNANALLRNAKLSINSVPAASLTITKQTIINNTLNMPDLVLVDFDAGSYNLTNTVASPALDFKQNVKLDFTYGDLSATPATPPLNVKKDLYFNLAIHQVQVSNVYFLPGITASNVFSSSYNVSTPRKPLDGIEVSSNDFFVFVEADNAAIAANTLNITTLPIGAITYVSYGFQYTDPTTKTSFYLYEIKAFPEGVQNLQFDYGANSSNVRAKVTYATKNYVLLNNIYDGMVIEIDSSVSATPNIPVSGQIIGFTGYTLSKQFIVNGVDRTAIDFVSPDYDSTTETFNLTKLKVDSAAGPLYVGENKIKFIIKYTSSSGIVRDYVNEVKIYIIDKNTPTVKMAIPLTPPTSGLPTNNLNDPAKAYLVPSNEFQPKPNLPGSYKTTLKSVDYFLEASGASKVTIKKGGNVIFQFTPSGSIQTESGTSGTIFSQISAVTNNLPAGTSIDYYGDTSLFRVRINADNISVAGTYVYTVELGNPTGAAVTKTIEIERNPATYVRYAPVANVGNRIVVNRNFVDFDIEAEGATSVTIDGVNAPIVPNKPDRFARRVEGLKPDKDNKIKIVITRPSGNTTDDVTVYYSSDVDVDAMYLTKLSGKMTVFNKQLELSFPKGMILRRISDKKIYPDTSVLFGIASPYDGYLGRVDDYGNSIDDPITAGFMAPVYAQTYDAFKAPVGGIERFSNVSPYYWISVGYAERGNSGQTNYQPATGGLAPYSNAPNTNMFISLPSYPDPSFAADQRKLMPAERGTLKLAFDPTIVEDTGSYLTVYFLGDSGMWKNLGGVVDMKSHTISVPFSDFGYYMVGKLKYSFPDITNHQWARNVLQALFAKGLMPNFEYSFFHTDEDTTRGEFAAMLVRALDLPLVQDQDNTFLDIVWGTQTISWSFEEIETAARAGIISGFSDRTFEAGLPITREQAATMIAKALNLKLAANNSKLQTKIGKNFTDASQMTNYALPAIDAVSSAKYMVGNAPDPANPKALAFNSQANLTRAEAGQILVNILQKYRKVFPINLS